MGVCLSSGAFKVGLVKGFVSASNFSRPFQVFRLRLLASQSATKADSDRRFANAIRTDPSRQTHAVADA
jgi:hypothetical protein